MMGGTTILGQEKGGLAVSGSTMALGSPPENRRFPRGSVPYRWTLLPTMFLYNCFSGLVLTTTSVLYAEYVVHFQASRAVIGWSVSLHTAMLYLSGIFISRPLEIYGGGPIAFIGTLLLSIGFLLSSQVTNVYVLYVTQGLLTGLGNCMVETTSFLMIQQHFTKHRALAAGLAILGVNIGNFVAPVLMRTLIDTYGWRGALMIFSAIIAHMMPLSLTFRKQEVPHRKQPVTVSLSKIEHIISQEKLKTVTVANTFLESLSETLRDAFDFSLLRKRSFLLYCIGGGLIFRMVLVGFIQHFTARALHSGLDKHAAAMYLSVFFITATIARIVVAFLGNLRFVSVQVIYIIGVAFGAGASYLMCALPSIYGPAASAIAFGLAVGFSNTVFSVVLVELHGPENINRSLMLFYFILGFGALLGTPFMGLIYDVTGSYDVPYYINAGLGTLGTILCILMYICYRREDKYTKEIDLS